MTETITSASNPALKLARALISRRRTRQSEKAFCVDGARVLDSLLANGCHLRYLFIEHEREHEIDTAILDRLTYAAGRVLLLDSRLYASITDTEHPQPIAGVFDMPEQEFPRTADFILGLDSIRDPGNLGTIIRTADAAGVDGVALLPGTVDPFNPKVVRASAGSVAGVPLRFFRNIHDVVQQAYPTSAPQIVAADRSGTIAYDRVDWTRPSLLIVGNEAYGVSSESQDCADFIVTIPIRQAVESLNAAISSAVIMFEAQRQRQH